MSRQVDREALFMSGDSGFVHMSCLVNSQSRMINQSAAAKPNEYIYTVALSY